MNRRNIWTWLSAGAMCAGTIAALAGPANADAWDRDEVGRNKTQEFRQQISQRDAAPARPSTGESVTGRQMGQDTITKGSHEFKNAAEMMSHLNMATKLRMTAGGEAEADGMPEAAKAPQKASTVAEFEAKSARGQEQEVDKKNDKTLHDEQVTETSVTGRAMHQDTIKKGDQYREFKNKADMMAHMNMQTQMRITGEAGGDGDVSGAGAANAPSSTHDRNNSNYDKGNAGARPAMGGAHVSDPTKLTDRQRQQLAAEGMTVGKKQSSADVEDKTM